MATETEGTFDIDGTSLYTKTWTPADPVKAKLVFVHGFSDHVNLYNDFFRAVAAHGIQTSGFDQRGWGRSVTKPADMGHTGPTSKVIAELATFIQDKLPSDVPLFVMGHSMGGGEVITLAGDAQYEGLVSQVRGWILEAPFIAFAPDEVPSFLKVFAGRLAAKIFPTRQLKHHIPPEHLTRDPAAIEVMRHDKLCHDMGTLESLASVLDRTTAIASGEVKMAKHVRSMMLAHGDDDKTCSHAGAIQWMEAQDAIVDKTSKTYKGAYHQLHSDFCKDEFTKDLVAWILERCGKDDGTIAPKL